MGSVHAETFLVPAIGLAVLSLLLRTVSKQARRTATGFVVQYGLPFKILAVVSALMTVAFGCIYFVVKPESRTAVLFLVVLFAVVITLPLFLMVFFTRVEARDGCMIMRSPWRRMRRIPFDDVESVQFSKSRQRHEIRMRQHGKVYLHVYLSGIPELLDALNSKAGIKS